MHEGEKKGRGSGLGERKQKEKRIKSRGTLPAIGQLGPDVLEVGVPHVADAEDVDVCVPGDAFLHVGVELPAQFFALLGRLGQVHHFRALGFGHLEGGKEKERKKKRERESVGRWGGGFFFFFFGFLVFFFGGEVF